MFDRKLFYTLAAIVAVAIIVITLSSVPQQQLSNNNEEDTVISQTEAGLDTPAPIESDKDLPPAFIIKEYAGHIAVFYQNEIKPQIILETQVKFLPDYDRIQLASGIAVYSYEELSALIEDYIS